MPIESGAFWSAYWAMMLFALGGSMWAELEHVPPELNWQDSHGVLDRRFTGIDSPLGGGRCRLPILLIFEVG